MDVAIPFCTRAALGMAFWMLGYIASKSSHRSARESDTIVIPTWMWLLCGFPINEHRVTKQGFLLQMGGMLYVVIEVVASLNRISPMTSFRVSFWAMILSMTLVGVWFHLSRKNK